MLFAAHTECLNPDNENGECLNPAIPAEREHAAAPTPPVVTSSSRSGASRSCTSSRNIPQWPGQQCDLNPLSLRDDLSRYPSIALEDVNHGEEWYGAHARRYVIFDNVLYGRDGAPNAIVGVADFVEDMLVRLLQRVSIPNVDFVLNCADHPQVANYIVDRDASKNVPILSMCGSVDYRDIVVPTYTMALVATGRAQAHLAARYPWSERRSQLVWRGTDSNRDRFAFNILANRPEYQKWTDVGISQMVRLKHDDHEHGPVREYIPETHYGDYKWIANIDGAVAAYRMPAVMALGSTVVLQDSPFYEHWYRQLQPFVHYVPMDANFANLSSVLEWLREHDAEAQRIGEAGREFVLQHLQPQAILCYWYVFLHEYASHLTYEPTILDGMTRVRGQ
jgi:Glycosyl transferase family 90